MVSYRQKAMTLLLMLKVKLAKFTLKVLFDVGQPN